MMKRVIAAAIALAFVAPAFAEETVVKASDDSMLQVLSSVFAIHSLGDRKRNVVVRLFESGGGDPAVNGNRLLLAIISDPQIAPRVWRTGIDVYEVKEVSLDTEKAELAIAVVEQSPQDMRMRPGLYVIRYDVDLEEGAISETIRIRKD
jgi:hypothetical protein